MLSNLSSKSYLKSLKSIHSALISGLLFFLLISIYLIYDIGSGFLDDQNLKPLFRIIAAVYFLTALYLSRIVFKRNVKKSGLKTTLAQKLESYKKSTINRLAFMQSAGLFTIICYMLMGEWIYLAIIALIILIMMSLRPNPYKTISDLGLTNGEAQTLSNPEANIENE